MQVKLFDNDNQANDWFSAHYGEYEVLDVKLAATEDRNVLLVIFKWV